MFLTVYVDEETFQQLVVEGKSFDACLVWDAAVMIQLSVPIECVYAHNEPGMVTIQSTGQ